MGRDNDIRAVGDCRRRSWLAVDDVKRRSPDPAGLQCRNEGGVVNQATPAHIDDEQPPLALRKKGERRWHLATCMAISAVALVASTFFHANLVIGLACLTVAAVGVFSAMLVFWTIPTRYLSGTAAAGGIAMINSIALIGGFVSPTVIGAIKDKTGSTDIGLYVFATILVLGAACSSRPSLSVC
jgi:uncharacterized membrane protein YphA (DoxX/SURF4 family)